MLYLDTDHRYLFRKKNTFCVHEPDFTNAILINEVEHFNLSLSKTNSKNWEDITKSSHSRQIEEDEEKLRIKNYLDLDKKQYRNLKNEPTIYQIPVGEKEEFRAIVIFRKKQPDLLFFDPNHHFSPKFAKLKYPQGDDAVCLMKKERCQELYECHPLSEKEWKRLITERKRKKQ